MRHRASQHCTDRHINLWRYNTGGLPKLFEIATEADRPEFRALCLDLILDIARAVDMRVKVTTLVTFTI
jgi:hypothetical protein